MEKYSAKFRIDTHDEAYPTSPPADRPKEAAQSIDLGDSAATTTRLTSGERAESDLEVVLDTIRRLIPDAEKKTNEELKEYLFAVSTAGRKATDLATTKTVEESIRRKYQLPTIEFSAIDISSPTRATFGHTQAALDILPVLDDIKKFMDKLYDGGDHQGIYGETVRWRSKFQKNTKAQIETALSKCQDSAQKIGATDNFFLLSEGFDVLHNGHDFISKPYLEDLDLAPHELGQLDVLHAELTACELELSRKAVSTIHQGVAPSDLFSEHDYASRYFWGGGKEVLGMSLAFPTKSAVIW